MKAAAALSAVSVFAWWGDRSAASTQHDGAVALDGNGTGLLKTNKHGLQLLHLAVGCADLLLVLLLTSLVLGYQ